MDREALKREMEEIENSAIARMNNLNAEAQSILRRFLDGELPGANLEQMLKKADSEFKRWRDSVAPGGQ